MARLTDEEIERLTEKLDEVRAYWSDFKEAYQSLCEEFLYSGNSTLMHQANRTGAYQPGFDPGYDWGMGQNAEGWLEEMEQAIDGASDEEQEEI